MATCFGDSSGGHAPLEVVGLFCTNPPTIHVIVWAPHNGVQPQKLFLGPKPGLGDSGLGAGVPPTCTGAAAWPQLGKDKVEATGCECPGPHSLSGCRSPSPIPSGPSGLHFQLSIKDSPFSSEEQGNRYSSTQHTGDTLSISHQMSLAVKS